MAFAQGPTVIHIKLTDKGRQLLSTGQLTFKKFALGDSEINYSFNDEISFDAFNQKMLRPKDKYPNIVDFIEQSVSGETIIDLPTVVSNTSIITNTAPERGLFNTGTTSFELFDDIIHVKNPYGAVDISTVDGTNQLQIIQSPDYSAGAFPEPVIGDYTMVKWANPLIISGTTSRSVDEPVPYIWYKIEDIISGSLAGNDLIVEVDRPLPDFNGQGVGIKSLVHFYPNSNNRLVSGDSVQQYYGAPFITDFVEESVLAFIENYDVPTIDVPVWNMSIIFTEDVAGVSTTDRNFSQYFTNELGGFVRYIQQITPWIKKIGVIHYTNNSPSNNYGEGLVGTTPILDLPTIMWHKSTDNEIGLTLTASGSSKTLSGLSTTYHDLADENGFVVGKVFNDLKIFVIEDQELLFAMSYKANRSWTLPEFSAGLNVSLCPESDVDVVIIGTGDTTTTTTTTTIAGPTTTTTTTGINAKFNGNVVSASNFGTNKVVVTGNFTEYDGTPVGDVVVLNDDGTLDGTFTSQGFDAVPNDIIGTSSNEIIAVGNFTEYGASTGLSYITKLTSTGAIDGTFNPGTGFDLPTVYKVIETGSGYLVGGRFDSYDGVGATRRNIVKLNTNGSHDVTFQSWFALGFASYSIEALFDTGSDYYMGGTIALYDGITTTDMTKINDSTGAISDITFNTNRLSNPFNNIVKTVTVNSGNIFSGGLFTSTGSYGDVVNTIGSGFVDYNINGPVYTSTPIGSDILIGGSFSSILGSGVNDLARVNSSNTVVGSFNTGSGFNGNVLDVFVASNGNIIVTGEFTTYKGQPHNRIVALDSSGNVVW